MSTLDLFTPPAPPSAICLQGQLFALPGFAVPWTESILTELQHILERAPLRHFQTPGGLSLSAAQSNCGLAGWVSDARGYRYSKTDPLSHAPWPPLPAAWLQLARTAADLCGFALFNPDVCLINEYQDQARMSLHQDKNERSFLAPIVSVSLGMSCVFLWGGKQRHDPVQRYVLHHGDVLVWGGADRLRFHGVRSPYGQAPQGMAGRRINLTFRQAL